MSIMDLLPMTNIRCMRPAPDGKRCQFVADDEITFRHHDSDHYRFIEDAPHRWWDNCQVCRHPIRLTAALRLRVHGHPSTRCAGSGYEGLFQLRCKGEQT